jgi:hypothetical protein
MPPVGEITQPTGLPSNRRLFQLRTPGLPRSRSQTAERMQGVRRRCFMVTPIFKKIVRWLTRNPPPSGHEVYMLASFALLKCVGRL